MAVAVGFTALANVLVASSLVWTEWLPVRTRLIGLATLAVVWVLAWLESRADWRRLAAEWSTGQSIADPAERSDQWFREAQGAYLAGDWVAAEKALLQLLQLNDRDAEARLMLATLWRHEGRPDDARRELDRLETYETAALWSEEIAAERKQLEPASVVESEPQQPDAAVVRPNNEQPTDRQPADRPLEDAPEIHALGERRKTPAETSQRRAA